MEKKILSDDLIYEKCSGLINAATKILTGEISKNVLRYYYSSDGWRKEDIHYTFVIIIVLMSTLWKTKDYDFINSIGQKKASFQNIYFSPTTFFYYRIRGVRNILQSAKPCTIYTTIVFLFSFICGCIMLLYPQVCRCVQDLIIDTGLRWIV